MSLADAQTACSNAAAAIASEDYAAAHRFVMQAKAYLGACPTVRHGDRAIETSALWQMLASLEKDISAARKSSAGIRFTSTTRVPLTGSIE
jgi:hypothetical protein